jgi:hypothetical protein
VKFSLFVSGKRMLDAALSQAIRQEAIKETVRPSARLLRAGALLEPQSAEARHIRPGRLAVQGHRPS